MVAGRIIPDIVHTTNDPGPVVGRRYVVGQENEAPYEEGNEMVVEEYFQPQLMNASKSGAAAKDQNKAEIVPKKEGIETVKVKNAKSPEREETLYIIDECLGKGGFGQVNTGHLESCVYPVAVKFEKCNKRLEPTTDEESESISKLEQECAIYRNLGKCSGFPALYAYGYYKGYYFMAMDRLGVNLVDKQLKILKDMNICKEIAHIAIQAITILKEFHETGYVHADVKPDNFVYGTGEKENELFLIDFGLADRWRDASEPPCHVAYDQQLNKFRGTRHYASVHAHLGRNGSRRDDLESLVYTLLFLMIGHLPWQKYEERKNYSKVGETEKAKNRMKKNFVICKMKMAYSPERLSLFWPEDCRQHFRDFLEHVLNLGFFDEPKYEEYIKLFENIKCHHETGGIPKTRLLIKDGTADLSSQWISIYNTCRVIKQRYHYNVSVDPKMLPHYIEKGNNEGLFISHVASSGNRWVLIMEEGTGFTDQVYKVLRDFDDKFWIEEQWNQSYYISSLAGLKNGNCLVVMSKGSSYTHQWFEKSDYFPENWLLKGWKDGFLATAMTTAGSQWAVVMSQDPTFSDIEQAVELDFRYPAEGIYYRWKSGYRIAITAATCDQVAFVFNRRKKDPNLKSTFPDELVKREHHASSAERICMHEKQEGNWSRAFYVTSLCRGKTVL